MDDMYRLHDVALPDSYMPSPGAHLTNERDCEHYLATLTLMISNGYNSILDVGCYDGWHPILLARDEFEVVGVEYIHSLAEAGRRYINTSRVLGVQIIEGSWIEAIIPITKNKDKKYDLVTCYEVLEHIPWEEVDGWVNKMEEYGKTISISLPNQNHDENTQHKWTPTEALIKAYFGNRKNLKIVYKEYPTNPSIPGNWFITYGS